MHSAANAADTASWAAVVTWQDERRQQQNSVGYDRGALPAQDVQRLCEVQLQVVQHPTDPGQLVRLVLTLLDAGQPGREVAAGASVGRNATAAQLQLRLTRIEAEAAQTIDRAAEELAIAIDKSAAAQHKLLDEHVAAVSKCLNGIDSCARHQSVASLQLQSIPDGATPWQLC